MQSHQRLNKTKVVMFNYSGITISVIRLRYEKKVRFEYLQSNRTLYEKYKINFSEHCLIVKKIYENKFGLNTYCQTELYM